MPLHPGQQVLHYRLIEKIGEGGMGVVWKAEDPRLGRHVALKFIPDEVARDRERVERFLREARAASATNHPNICSIHDIGDWDGRRFIVMEIVEGRSLRRHIDGKPMDVGTAVDLAIQVADALAAAHAKGIIHRDIKPDNVFVTGDPAGSPSAKILDFGLAKMAAGPAPESPTDHAARTAMDLTAPTTVTGTLPYMPPEQALGKELDPRTDLFSLGAVLYEMITGSYPFEGESSAEVLEALLTRVPAAPTDRNPNVPPQLDRVVEKALEKDPARRYQTAGDLRGDLDRVRRDLSGQADPAARTTPAKTSKRRLRLLGSAAAVLAAEEDATGAGEVGTALGGALRAPGNRAEGGGADQGDRAALGHPGGPGRLGGRLRARSHRERALQPAG
jgi:serine/threonine protein kinase